MLYGATFAAFGVASPFLPGLLAQDGLSPGSLSIVLASGTAIRLVAGPFGGRLADRVGKPAIVLAGFSAAAAVIATGYAAVRGLPLLLLVSVAHASVLAPITPVSDALALGSAHEEPQFQYGWVRAAGSAAFIVGTLASGQIVGAAGLGSIVWMNGGLLAVAACLAFMVPNRVAGAETDPGQPGASSFAALLRTPIFAKMMVAATLIGGSHAMHDGFEVIRWRSAGLSPAQCSILWALSVAAEVAVFSGLGRPVLAFLGPGRAVGLSAAAGVVRWGTAASTASFPILACIEPLHGLTFALLHLACMDVIGRVVPAAMAATAQAFYATVAMGAASACVTLIAGRLYGNFGAAAFWPMSAMCLLALPVALSVRLPAAKEV